MSIAKVVRGFSRLRDDEIDTRAQSIIEKMTGNENFPNPIPALVDVTAALTAYRQALVQTFGGGKDKTAIKNARRFELENVLAELAFHVQVASKGDLGKLLSSGFDAHKSPSPVGDLEKPNFKLENGIAPGSMKVSVEKLHGAESYTYEYAVAPVSEGTRWTTLSLRARVHLFEGLTSGQQYAFRVAGIGTNQTLVYSDVISRYTL